MKNNALISSVMPGLYIGDFIASRNKELLLSLGITHILVAASDLCQFYPEVYIMQDFKYKQLDCIDMPNQDIAQFFEDSNE
jgi:serine/threonine/tyrosine-interacting protein